MPQRVAAYGPFAFTQFRVKAVRRVGQRGTPDLIGEQVEGGRQRRIEPIGVSRMSLRAQQTGEYAPVRQRNGGKIDPRGHRRWDPVVVRRPACPLSPICHHMWCAISLLLQLAALSSAFKSISSSFVPFVCVSIALTPQGAYLVWCEYRLRATTKSASWFTYERALALKGQRSRRNE